MFDSSRRHHFPLYFNGTYERDGAELFGTVRERPVAFGEKLGKMLTLRSHG